MTQVTVPEYGWNTDTPHTAAYLHPAIDALAGPLPAGTRVLDIGCGNGTLSGAYLSRGWRVVGVDASPQGIEAARVQFPAGRWETVAADRSVLDQLGEEPFDLVISTEVVEHLYAPRDWARGCFAALRPGGTLICTTPYHGYLKNLTIALLNKTDAHFNPLWDGGHIKFWSRRTLGRLLSEAGFRDLRFQGAGRLAYLWMSMAMSGKRPA